MRRMLSVLLALVLVMAVPAQAVVADADLSAAVADAAGYVYRTVAEPQVGSIGGEWAVLGLARSGWDVPETYFQDYYARVEEYVTSCGGVLHEKKYTEYSRVIMALSAIGKDARNVAGYDLVAPLGDYDKTIWQGMNGPIWALIALDSGNYPMPEGTATRQRYIDRILECQLADGGWSLFGGTASAGAGDAASDPDITGMALQALAKYQDQAAVAAAVERALDCVSAMQDDQGGFSSWGTANSESCVQVIVGLCELGVSLEDPRFVKNGNTLLDNLMTFYLPGEGFRHTADGSGSNGMASEQGLYALVAAQRLRQGKNSLYRMDDALAISDAVDRTPTVGLAGKNDRVQVRPVTKPRATFPDVDGHASQAAIEAMAEREIINGKDTGLFDPSGSMTRAEFATIVVKALGLPPQVDAAFSDVAPGDWFAPYVGAASGAGIINGVGDGTFNPYGTITRQECAVMVARAAKLCGMDAELDAMTVRDTLAVFTDYVTTADWARNGLAVCYREGILDDSGLEIQPTQTVERWEVAQMLYNLLGVAKLR